MWPEEFLPSSQVDWARLFEVFGPTVATLVVGGAGFWAVVWQVSRSARLGRKQHQHEVELERAGLAAALIGEISSIILLIEHRGYIGALGDAIDRAKEDPINAQPFSFVARQNYFEVFSGNVDRLGLLRGPLADGVVRFYAACKSVLEDAEVLYHEPDTDPEMLVQRMEGMLDMIVDNEKLGIVLIKGLAKISGQPLPYVVPLMEQLFEEAGSTIDEKEKEMPPGAN